MTDQPAGRLVWLTEESVNELIDGKISARSLVWQAWLAAPADPAEAVRQWFSDHFSLDDYDAAHTDEIAASVLSALGCPPSEHTRDAS